jgi:hypothetical protein
LDSPVDFNFASVFFTRLFFKQAGRCPSSILFVGNGSTLLSKYRARKRSGDCLCLEDEWKAGGTNAGPKKISHATRARPSHFGNPAKSEFYEKHLTPVGFATPAHAGCAFIG